MNSIVMMTTDTIERQREYVNAQKAKGLGLGVVFADAFLRGMRDLGYKNPAWAFAEQIDNSFQSGADVVSIRFGYEPGNKNHTRPDQIAVCDNGNGMIPEMISYAVRWGGTDREEDRKGFGRYGYGLPSSAVSMAKRYSVYSKPAGGSWQVVTVDIDELAAAAGDIKRTQELLEAKPAKLPKWLLAKTADLDLATLDSGTVVVLEVLDRLNRQSGWIKSDTLRTKLLQHFGVIYRHLIPERRVIVDGISTQVVDPLFLMEHARFYNETSVLAHKVETRSFEVETSRGTKGTVSIRASFLPPNFQLADPHQFNLKGGKKNKRMEVMRDYNGLLICRAHRQIDCIVPAWTKFQNYDVNIKIEIDFDPELDESFGMTTAKQQIVIDDDMWEKLKSPGKNGGGLQNLIKDMRRRFMEWERELEADSQNRSDKDAAARASAVAMAETEKFKTAVAEPTPAQREEAKKNLEEMAEERASVTGEPKEKVIEELTAQTTARRWEVEFASIPEGPFYRSKRLGEQKRLVINTDHPFYAKIYNAAPAVRGALEVLLFVLAERELDVKNDAEIFYRSERQRWSERLRHALDRLLPEDAMEDKASAVAERLQVAEDEEAVAA